jgi:hypothetical protein
MIELLPNIVLSDGHNLIEAVFTKESMNEFRKMCLQQKFSGLRDKAIYIYKWSLQIEYLDSRSEYNSYQNIAIKLVVEQFKPVTGETIMTKYLSPSSLFRNPETKIYIENFRHWFTQQLILK